MREKLTKVDPQKVDEIIANFDGDKLVKQAVASMDSTVENLGKAITILKEILSIAESAPSPEEKVISPK